MAGALALKDYVQIPIRSDSGRLSSDSHQQQEQHNVPDPSMQQREPSMGYPVCDHDTSRSGSYTEHRPSVDKEIKVWQPTVGSPPPAYATPLPAPASTVSPSYSQLDHYQLEQMYLPQQFGSPYNNPVSLAKPTQFGTPYSHPGSAKLQTLISSPAPAHGTPSPAPNSTESPAYPQRALYQIQQVYVPQQFGSPYNNPAGLSKPREFGSPYNNPAGLTKPTQFGSPYNNPGSTKQQLFASPQPGPLYVRQVPLTPGRELTPYITPGRDFTPSRPNMMRSEHGTPLPWTSDEAVGCLSGCRACFWRR